MLGATQVGVEELRKVVADFGRARHDRAVQRDPRPRRPQAARRDPRLPDGVYRAEESYDNDCFSAVKVALRLALTKSAERHRRSISRAPTRRSAASKTRSLANTYSAVYAGIASFFDSDLPRNEGTFRCVSIVAPPGTVVNALPPAPLTMCTVFPPTRSCT